MTGLSVLVGRLIGGLGLPSGANPDIAPGMLGRRLLGISSQMKGPGIGSASWIFRAAAMLGTIGHLPRWAGRLEHPIFHLETGSNAPRQISGEAAGGAPGTTQNLIARRYAGLDEVAGAQLGEPVSKGPLKRAERIRLTEASGTMRRTGDRCVALADSPALTAVVHGQPQLSFQHAASDRIAASIQAALTRRAVQASGVHPKRVGGGALGRWLAVQQPVLEKAAGAASGPPEPQQRAWRGPEEPLAIAGGQAGRLAAQPMTSRFGGHFAEAVASPDFLANVVGGRQELGLGAGRSAAIEFGGSEPISGFVASLARAAFGQLGGAVLPLGGAPLQVGTAPSLAVVARGLGSSPLPPATASHERMQAHHELMQGLPPRERRVPVGRAAWGGTPLVPPPTGAEQSPLLGSLYVDGERMGNFLAKRIAAGLNRSPAGGGDFDFSASYAPAGMPLSVA